MLPNVFVVGAAKAGTSSMYQYLSQHPDICMSKVKESLYFNDTKPEAKKVKCFQEYEACFDHWNGEKIVGEASPSYLYYKGTADLIYDFNPDVKILIMLRHPVDRFFSHYLMDVNAGLIRMPFPDLVAEEIRAFNGEEKCWGEEFIYLGLGLYSLQVQRYFDVFGKSRVKVLLFDDLVQDHQGLMREVFEFLGVDPDVIVLNEKHNAFRRPKYSWVAGLKQNKCLRYIVGFVPKGISKAVLGTLHTVNDKPMMDSGSSKLLASWYRQDILNLESLMDRDLGLWLNKY